MDDECDNPNLWNPFPKDDAWKRCSLRGIVDAGRRLWLDCCDCNRHRYISVLEWAEKHGVDLDTPHLLIARRVRCSRCGRRAVKVRSQPYSNLLLKDQSKLVPVLALARLSPAQVGTKLASARRLAQHLDQPNTHERRKLILSLLSRIEIAEASVTLKLSTPGLRQALGLSDTSKTDGEMHEVVLPVRFSKRHVEQKIILAAEGERQTNRDDVLLKAVARAQTWFEDLKHQRFRDLAEIARHEKLPKTYVHALMPLAFLAPSIVTAILSGRQPADLTLKQLMLRTDLALDWTTPASIFEKLPARQQVAC